MSGMWTSSMHIHSHSIHVTVHVTCLCTCIYMYIHVHVYAVNEALYMYIELLHTRHYIIRPVTISSAAACTNVHAQCIIQYIS